LSKAAHSSAIDYAYSCLPDEGKIESPKR